MICDRGITGNQMASGFVLLCVLRLTQLWSHQRVPWLNCLCLITTDSVPDDAIWNQIRAPDAISNLRIFNLFLARLIKQRTGDKRQAPGNICMLLQMARCLPESAFLHFNLRHSVCECNDPRQQAAPTERPRVRSCHDPTKARVHRGTEVQGVPRSVASSW